MNSMTAAESQLKFSIQNTKSYKLKFKKTLSTKEDGNLPKSGILTTLLTTSSVKLRKISLLLECSSKPKPKAF
jgi:hypothetical protein